MAPPLAGHYTFVPGPMMGFPGSYAAPGYAGGPVFPAAAPPMKTMSESERELLEAALVACRGRIPEVARSLGVSRGTVYNKMKKFNLDPGTYRG